VSLEVRDTNGTVVRRVASTDAPEYDADQMQREIIPQYWIKQTPAPSAKAGMHRWVWDLHYAPPRSVKRGYPISAVPHETPSEPRGPAAVPGAYQVVLRAGSREWRAPLTVMPDPRVSATAADFEAQFTAARELAGVLDESTEALQRAQSLRDQIKKLLEKPATLADKLHEMDGHLAVLLKPDGAQSQARGLEQLNGDAVILYGQVEAADAAPTAVQMSETDRAISDWQALAPRWHDLQNEVKATNLALGKAKLPKLAPEKPVPRDLNFADED
jgi:flagellar biosynthesis/type III secretory pathway chaperone